MKRRESSKYIKRNEKKIEKRERYYNDGKWVEERETQMKNDKLTKQRKEKEDT